MNTCVFSMFTLILTCLKMSSDQKSLSLPKRNNIEIHIKISISIKLCRKDYTHIFVGISLHILMGSHMFSDYNKKL